MDKLDAAIGESPSLGFGLTIDRGVNPLLVSRARVLEDGRWDLFRSLGASAKIRRP